jgi:hypothetical protein
LDYVKKKKSATNISDYCVVRIIIVSLVSSGGHFAFKLDQSMGALLRSTLTEPRNLVILLGRTPPIKYVYFTLIERT